MKTTTITLDVDVEQMALNILAKSDERGYYSLKESVEQEIRSQIVANVATEIRAATDIKSLFVGWGEKYLSDEAKRILNNELKTKVEEYTSAWIKNHLAYLVGDLLRKEFEKQILPRAQKLVASMVVVNEESIEEQIAELEQYAQDAQSNAYDAGQQAAADEIRKSI